MTFSLLKSTASSMRSDPDRIGDLANKMKILAGATTQLETYIKTLKPSNSITNEDITRALEALQEGLTGYTSNLLDGLKGKTEFNDLIFEIKLVEVYLQQTRSLNKSLSTLKTLDQESITHKHPTYSTNVQNFPVECQPSTGTTRDLYEVVPCVRHSLATTLDDILKELNLTEDEVGIAGLLRESQSILTQLDSILKLLTQSFDPNFPGDFVNLVDLFKTHLKTARDIFNKVNRKGSSLDDGEAKNIQELVGNWRKITQKIQAITGKEDLSDSQDRTNAIAQSIQIHDLLEDNYDFLSDLVRSGDLTSPGIL